MSNTDDQRLILFVRVKSRLSNDEILKRARERMPQFRALAGLQQKYYVYDPATGEFGGIYVWDSQKSLDEYKASDLRKSIAAAYEAVGEPRIEALNVVEVLRTESSVA